MKKKPEPAKHPFAYRWCKHINSLRPEFPELLGDPSKDYTSHGPASIMAAPSKANENEDADDIDLFGCDDEEDSEKVKEAARQREQRLDERGKKKAGKDKPPAKTILTLDVKLWDDETNMQELEDNIRDIHKEGLLWARSQLIAVGFVIKKLQINVIIEDDKVSLDELQEEIEGLEEYLQSTDVATMQKW